MVPTYHLTDGAFAEFYEVLLPDFVLAFVFFTALCYAVLVRRFLHQQRPAITISVVMGIALAIGLVWWEQQSGYTIRNLGPIAIGFAIMFLAAVVYQAFKLIGGRIAGTGFALAVCILIAWLLEVNLPVKAEIIQIILTVALFLGLIAFLTHTKIHGYTSSPVQVRPLPPVKHNMRDLEQPEQEGRMLSDLLGRRLHGIRKESELLYKHPELSGNIIQQIKRTLPAEGQLTERMAQLRKKAHQIRNGHIARLKETRHVFAALPTSTKKAAAAELATRYKQLIGIDQRLERLDNAVAATEKQIIDLTQQAGQYAQKYEHRKLTEVFKTAEKLQKHNTHLFKLIDCTEQKLTAIAKAVAEKSKEVSNV